jgi:hypothetical protein
MGSRTNTKGTKATKNARRTSQFRDPVPNRIVEKNVPSCVFVCFECFVFVRVSVVSR